MVWLGGGNQLTEDRKKTFQGFAGFLGDDDGICWWDSHINRLPAAQNGHKGQEVPDSLRPVGRNSHSL